MQLAREQRDSLGARESLVRLLELSAQLMDREVFLCGGERVRIHPTVPRNRWRGSYRPLALTSAVRHRGPWSCVDFVRKVNAVRLVLRASERRSLT